ncbi:uncharacterized protein LOC122429493 [Cervus canadensis]|uniref:uncharacterized protein LOC122429493 n=1 Tax=Cervus canadensis TaxID=1574408 RepID=UPI001CA34AD6|nr:uncharacterized protein LOC122429493 [Cervus canadensis]
MAKKNDFEFPPHCWKRPPTTTTSPSNELPDLSAPPGARSRVGSLLATGGIVYSCLIAPSVFWGYFTWFFVFLIRRGGGLRLASGGVLFSASPAPILLPHPPQEDRRLRGFEFDRLHVSRGEGSRKGPSARTERLHAGEFPFCFWRAFFPPSPPPPPPPPLFFFSFFFSPLPLQPEEETLSDRRSEMTREPSWKATPARTRGGEEKATNWKGGE